MYSQRYEIKKIIREFKDSLGKHGIRTERVILFGSHARGTAQEDSDIDLIVISNDFKDMDFMQRCECLGRAIAEIMEPIEPLAYTPEEFNIEKQKKNILHEVLLEPHIVEYQA